jgi:hypothetical protein
MNNNELVLFKEMIKETFRNVLKEELPKLIKEELESMKKSSSKDLKEVKLLIAHQIKKSKSSSAEKEPLTETTKSRLGEVFSRSNKIPPRTALAAHVANTIPAGAPSVVKDILVETANQMNVNDMQDLGIGEEDPEWSESEDNSYIEAEDDYTPPNMPDFPMTMTRK